jgi:uncharacterized protein YbgA (DUF1722 family)/uncharacterized protein YbbK (DUF523 family)
MITPNIIKPNIIISKCINFDNCRFNGWIIKDSFLELLWKYVNYIPVCPEVAIWLSTPRLPLRIFKDWNIIQLYQPATETYLTKKMNIFAQDFLKAQKNIDWFVLKNWSPSCWIWDVRLYDKKISYTFQKKWKWIFTENIDKIYSNIPKEDEWRLKNFKLREEFLTKIFCIAEFRYIRKNLIISEISDFQAKNKYLFMFYSPKIQKELWQIIGSYNKTNINEIFDDYNLKLLELFWTETKIWKMINALTHIFWYFKNNCSSDEKEFFCETIEEYREWRIPTSSVISILKTLALRDKKEYIISQSILNPYPKELIELSDSWKILKL